jgi:molybdopterin-guanine dinucleotide biosynthesis protein A
VGDRRIIDRVADSLSKVTPKLVLLSNDHDASQWLAGVAVLADRIPGVGGLAGVHAVLATGNDALVVAWDMPFVTPGLLEAIIVRARETDADAVVPLSHSPKGFEPFCAFYAARGAGVLERRLRRPQPGAPSDFLAELERVERVGLDRIAQLGDPDRLFLSVNTPDDLARARDHAGAGRRSSPASP